VRILVVDDDPKLGKLLLLGLSENGSTADLTTRGEDALTMAKARYYDAIVLDAALPGLDGIQTCVRLRADGVWTPVLMLTAREALESRIIALDSGADDCLTKPFAISELQARLRSVVRRGASARPAILEVGDLHLDPATQQAWRGGVEVRLSKKEFALLELLMRRPGQLVSRYDLLEYVWDMGYDNRSNVVTVHIASLRAKIDRRFQRGSIETVRGAGYRLRKDDGV
jgi:two-component system, OmpR family, response regulator